MAVEQDRSAAPLDGRCMAIGEIIVHPAATFERGGPGTRRNLLDVAGYHAFAEVVLVGPQAKLQRKTMDADDGSKIFNLFDQRRVGTGGDEHAHAQIVTS